MRRTLLAAIGLTLLLPLPVAAQIQMPRSVLGSGAGGGASSALAISGTLGQATIGRLAGPSWLHGAGFWAGPPVPTAAGEAPLVFRLDQNFPNPFNPVTTIRYSLAKSGSVDLRLFDPTGRQVARLVGGEQAAGRYAFTLRADDLASGVYFYKLVAGDFQETRKLILLK